MNSLSQRRSMNRHGAREIQRTIDAALAEIASEKASVAAEHALLYVERRGAKPYTADELRAATHVRTDVGWHKVVRVSAKSVTVDTGYSWHDRYSIANILEVRSMA